MKYTQFAEEYKIALPTNKLPHYHIFFDTEKISEIKIVNNIEKSKELDATNLITYKYNKPSIFPKYLRKVYNTNEYVITAEPTEYVLTHCPSSICPSRLPTQSSSNTIITKIPPTIEKDDLVYGLTAGLGSFFFIIIVLYVYCNYTKRKNKQLYIKNYTRSSSSNISNDIYDKYNSFF
jgi:hypothetical protein